MSTSAVSWFDRIDRWIQPISTAPNREVHYRRWSSQQRGVSMGNDWLGSRENTVANWTVVAPYNDEDYKWLRENGYRAPIVRKGNEMPSTADVKWVLESVEGLEFDYPIGEDELWAESEAGGLVLRGFDWDWDKSTAGDHFLARGGDDLLTVLIRLCERCGQLYFYL
jgi:hypothetical protein